MQTRNRFPHGQDAQESRRDDLEEPRTQIIKDREAYLGQGGADVGRRISDDQVELFASADVGDALQHEFTRLAPEFITLHDVGTSSGVRLLTSLASASGTKLQRLSIRRQGHGVALAVLQFTETALADGTPVRVYATDINADSHTRRHVSRVLLAHSRLGVLLVGALPPHALATQFMPLREMLKRGPWPNRDLLLLPLGATTALSAQATQLGSQLPVAVHVTPQADNPRQAWSFITGAWNRLHGQPGGERALPAEPAPAAPPPRRPGPAPEAHLTDPMPLPPPRQPAAAPPPLAPAQMQAMPKPGGTQWQNYADRCAQVKGTLACCLFDVHTLQMLAHTAGLPVPERLAQHGATLLGQMQEASRALGLSGSPVEASFSTPGHHLLMRAVPGHPGVAVALLLAGESTLTLARMQLERIEPPK